MDVWQHGWTTLKHSEHDGVEYIPATMSCIVICGNHAVLLVCASSFGHLMVNIICYEKHRNFRSHKANFTVSLLQILSPVSFLTDFIDYLVTKIRGGNYRLTFTPTVTSMNGQPFLLLSSTLWLCMFPCAIVYCHCYNGCCYIS